MVDRGVGGLGSSLSRLLAISTELPLHGLHGEGYDQIVAAQALDERRVELIDGVPVETSPRPRSARASASA